MAIDASGHKYISLEDLPKQLQNKLRKYKGRRDIEYLTVRGMGYYDDLATQHLYAIAHNKKFQPFKYMSKLERKKQRQADKWRDNIRKRLGYEVRRI